MKAGIYILRKKFDDADGFDLTCLTKEQELLLHGFMCDKGICEDLFSATFTECVAFMENND